MEKSVTFAKKKKGKINEYVKNKKYHKIRDHFHCAGEYTGAVHSICNLK